MVGVAGQVALLTQPGDTGDGGVAVVVGLDGLIEAADQLGQRGIQPVAEPEAGAQHGPERLLGQPGRGAAAEAVDAALDLAERGVDLRTELLAILRTHVRSLPDLAPDVCKDPANETRSAQRGRGRREGAER